MQYPPISPMIGDDTPMDANFIWLATVRKNFQSNAVILRNRTVGGWPKLFQLLAQLLPIAFLALATSAAPVQDPRGSHFFYFTNLSSFERTFDGRAGEAVYTSKALQAPVKWDELIVSWDAEMSKHSWLKIEARGFHGQTPTKSYTMALWSDDPAIHPRESVSNQKDDDGDVSTDTLILKQPADRAQLRVTIGGDENEKPNIKFIGLCVMDTRAARKELPPNQAAWGKTIPVPEKSQMAYPNGGVLCSPTTVSMLMSYWSRELKRPELDRDVPEVVKGVYDAKWKGAGNWPFNTAYPGSFPGMRGYVTRFSDVSELEDWVAKGIPVGVSLCYDRLRGRGPGPNGHLVVCVGFTKDGDVIINDPGTSKNVRKTFPRKSLVYAWANSKNAVYLIYPVGAEIPTDRFGHWERANPARR